MAALAEVISHHRLVPKAAQAAGLAWVGVPLPVTLRMIRPLTDEEMMQFSLVNEPYRIERNAQGELEIMSPLGGRGGIGESYLIRELDLWAEEHGGFSFSSQAGFRLPDTSIKMADASWISAERWKTLTDAEQISYPPLCPDFVMELLSPTDSRKDLEAKMLLWIANGAGLAWLIDPFALVVSIYRRDHPVQHLQRPEFVIAEDVVPGFRLKMERLWSPEEKR